MSGGFPSRKPLGVTGPRLPPTFPDSIKSKVPSDLLMAQPEAALEHEAMIEQLEDEIKQAAKDNVNDLALWAETTPDSKAQAQFLGNLRNRLLKGISRNRIEEMTIRDRVASAARLDEMRREELDAPSQNISFAQRFEMAAALPKLIAEVERRKREASTINGESVEIINEEAHLNGTEEFSG